MIQWSSSMKRHDVVVPCFRTSGLGHYTLVRSIVVGVGRRKSMLVVYKFENGSYILHQSKWEIKSCICHWQLSLVLLRTPIVSTHRNGDIEATRCHVGEL